MEEVQKDVKYSSISLFMLKPTSLFTQGFNENNKAHENILNNIYNFGSQSMWRNGRISASSYIDAETSKYQYRLINPTPLYCIVGYITEDAVGDRDLKRMPKRRLKLIYGSI